MSTPKKPASVDEYIASFPDNVRERLIAMRNIIVSSAPHAIESISYGMPAYKIGGKPLVYFAGFAKHVGFYATPNGHAEFFEELSSYKQGKGSVQFPLDRPLPVALIERIVRFRIAENAELKQRKAAKK